MIIILFHRIGNAGYLLKWIKNRVQDKAINICFSYDFACVLDTHLRVRFFGRFILIKLWSWYSGIFAC